MNHQEDQINDALFQGFIGASVLLSGQVDQVPQESPSKHLLSRVSSIMRQVIDEGRIVLQGLRSPFPPATNLEKAFAALLNEIGPANTSRIRVTVIGQPRPLKTAIQEQIYLIGREAIVNALRHAAATSIEVEVEYLRRRISLAVRDNGCGIEQKLLESRPELNYRLSGMSERAREIGARFQIWSKPGAGTELKLSLPIASELGSAA